MGPDHRGDEDRWQLESRGVCRDTTVGTGTLSCRCPDPHDFLWSDVGAEYETMEEVLRWKRWTGPVF